MHETRCTRWPDIKLSTGGARTASNTGHANQSRGSSPTIATKTPSSSPALDLADQPCSVRGRIPPQPRLQNRRSRAAARATRIRTGYSAHAEWCHALRRGNHRSIHGYRINNAWHQHTLHESVSRARSLHQTGGTRGTLRPPPQDRTPTLHEAPLTAETYRAMPHLKILFLVLLQVRILDQSVKGIAFPVNLSLLFLRDAGFIIINADALVLRIDANNRPPSPPLVFSHVFIGHPSRSNFHQDPDN